MSNYSWLAAIKVQGQEDGSENEVESDWEGLARDTCHFSVPTWPALESTLVHANVHMGPRLSVDSAGSHHMHTVTHIL